MRRCCAFLPGLGGRFEGLREVHKGKEALVSQVLVKRFDNCCRLLKLSPQA